MLCPFVSGAFRFSTCSWQGPVAIDQQEAGNAWMDIHVVRKHEYLSIMEDVAAIAETGEALGRNAVAAIVRRSADAQLIDIEKNGLLFLVVTLHDHILDSPVSFPFLLLR